MSDSAAATVVLMGCVQYTTAGMKPQIFDDVVHIEFGVLAGSHVNLDGSESKDPTAWTLSAATAGAPYPMKPATSCCCHVLLLPYSAATCCCCHMLLLPRAAVATCCCCHMLLLSRAVLRL